MTELRRRVLHVIDTTGPGGAETVFVHLASGLRQRAWDPFAVVVGTGWVLDRIRDQGIPYEILPTDRRFDISFMRNLRRVVIAQRIDLVHAHLFSPAVYASCVGLSVNVPVVATFHGESDVKGGRWAKHLRYRLIDRRARVVCVSRSLESSLVDEELVRASNIRVIHNGIDESAYQNGNRSRVRSDMGIDANSFLVGALGNIRPAKDYENFLRTAASLSTDPSFRFAIVGDPLEPHYSRLRAMRDASGLSDKLDFWGFRGDVADVIAAFDLLFVSSRSEGFSLATVQAMAAGTPIVATRSGGPQEIITHEADGLLVRVDDSIEAADAIRRVARDGDLRTKLVQAGRRTASDKFSDRAMLDAYDRLYEELLANR